MAAVEKALELQLRQACETPKNSYPELMRCGSCREEWRSHLGTLCPAKKFADRFDEIFAAFTIVANGGGLPERAQHFEWGGTYFVPLLEGDPLRSEWGLLPQ